jgi:hypothetical protein
MLVMAPLILQSEILRFEDLVIKGSPVALEGAIELLTQVKLSNFEVTHISHDR